VALALIVFGLGLDKLALSVRALLTSLVSIIVIVYVTVNNKFFLEYWCLTF